LALKFQGQVPRSRSNIPDLGNTHITNITSYPYYQQSATFLVDINNLNARNQLIEMLISNFSDK